jgi:hypothetical protein
MKYKAKGARGAKLAIYCKFYKFDAKILLIILAYGFLSITSQRPNYTKHFHKNVIRVPNRTTKYLPNT